MTARRTHFITGASGFIGRHLVRALCGRGERVVMLMRAHEGRSAGERARDIFGKLMDSGQLVAIQGDIMEPSLGIDEGKLARIVEGPLVVWHLAADLSFSPAKSAEAEQTNVMGTAHVVAFANQRAERLIHMSTAYVCGDAPGASEDEAGETPRFRNHYERSKYAAERIVRQSCTVPHLIIRPSIVIGDAYEGKAEGCTFGYYRFAFMLHIFHEWVSATLRRRSALSALLRLMRTRTDDGVVHAPWLILPYPADGVVDMVPIDHVVSTMIGLLDREEAWRLKTFLITQRDPMESLAVMQAAMEDLRVTGARYIRLSPRTFHGVLRAVYIVLFPLRQYAKSVFWYTPYVVRPYRFEHPHSDALGLPLPPPLTRDQLRRINAYAKENVFPGIDLEKLF